MFVGVQHLLVWGESLRDLIGGFAEHVAQDLPLVVEHLFEHSGLLFEGQIAGHYGVVDAAHRQRVDILIGAVLFDPFAQHLVDALLVGDVVPFAHRLAVPFAGVIEQQGLAMHRSHDDRQTVGDQFVVGIVVERLGAGVHGRTKVVALHAQEQFADFRIGFGADVAHFGLEGFGGPGLESEILVVDEQTAVFDRRLFRTVGFYVQRKAVLFCDGNVGPPVPRAYADSLRYGEYAVGGAPAV